MRKSFFFNQRNESLNYQIAFFTYFFDKYIFFLLKMFYWVNAVKYVHVPHTAGFLVTYFLIHETTPRSGYKTFTDPPEASVVPFLVNNPPHKNSHHSDFYLHSLVGLFLNLIKKKKNGILQNVPFVYLSCFAQQNTTQLQLSLVSCCFLLTLAVWCPIVWPLFSWGRTRGLFHYGPDANMSAMNILVHIFREHVRLLLLDTNLGVDGLGHRFGIDNVKQFFEVVIPTTGARPFWNGDWRSF